MNSKTEKNIAKGRYVVRVNNPSESAYIQRKILDAGGRWTGTPKDQVKNTQYKQLVWYPLRKRLQYSSSKAEEGSMDIKTFLDVTDLMVSVYLDEGLFEI